MSNFVFQIVLQENLALAPRTIFGDRTESSVSLGRASLFRVLKTFCRRTIARVSSDGVVLIFFRAVFFSFFVLILLSFDFLFAFGIAVKSFVSEKSSSKYVWTATFPIATARFQFRDQIESSICRQRNVMFFMGFHGDAKQQILLVFSCQVLCFR